MKNKREIIDNSHDHQCYKCLGDGKIKGSHPYNECNCDCENCLVICPTCKGTGVWKEEHYYLITEHQGQKICFDVDNLGK